MRNSEQRRLSVLESEYEAMLKIALKRCAGGCWGLFGQNDGKSKRAVDLPAEVDALLKLGVQIQWLRTRLGIPQPLLCMIDC